MPSKRDRRRLPPHLVSRPTVFGPGEAATSPGDGETLLSETGILSSVSTFRRSEDACRLTPGLPSIVNQPEHAGPSSVPAASGSSKHGSRTSIGSSVPRISSSSSQPAVSPSKKGATSKKPALNESPAEDDGADGTPLANAKAASSSAGSSRKKAVSPSKSTKTTKRTVYDLSENEEDLTGENEEDTRVHKRPRGKSGNGAGRGGGNGAGRGGGNGAGRGGPDGAKSDEATATENETAVAVSPNQSALNVPRPESHMQVSLSISLIVVRVYMPVLTSRPLSAQVVATVHQPITSDLVSPSSRLYPSKSGWFRGAQSVPFTLNRLKPTRRTRSLDRRSSRPPSLTRRRRSQPRAQVLPWDGTPSQDPSRSMQRPTSGRRRPTTSRLRSRPSSRRQKMISLVEWDG